jgi:uncharacterized tellurite resistance protein B-like protein
MDKAKALATAKVMIAVAWADGTLTPDEINRVTKVLHDHFDRESLLDEDWRLLDAYFAGRVGPGERARLIHLALHAVVRNQADADWLWSHVSAVADAGGDDEGAAALTEIRQALERHQPTGFLGRLFGAAPKHAGFDREPLLGLLTVHEAHFIAHCEYAAEGLQPEGDRDSFGRRAAIAACLVGAALADRAISDVESATCVRLLAEHWDCPEDSGQRLIVALARRGLRLDRFASARFLRTELNQEQRQALLVDGFAVANAEDGTDRDEIERLRQLSTDLGLDHEAYIEAKLTVPKAYRQGL